MKKDYLKRLEEELDKRNISNKEEILSKYGKRYSFGLESGMTEKEIEEMLKSPEEVAKNYDKNKDSNTNSKLKTNIDIKVLKDDIVFKESKDDKVHVLCEDINMSLYEIKNDRNNGVIVKFKTENYLSLNRKESGIFTIQIPKNRKFNEVKISTSQGNITVGQIKTSYILIQASKGNITANEIISPRININSVSGDTMIKDISATDINLSTVSGDISILKSKGNLKASVVSGNIEIKNHDGTYKVSSITGDVLINGERVNSLKDNIKGVK